MEFLQLFVYSRVTDVTDVIAAMAGGSIGVWIGSALKRERLEARHLETAKKMGVPA